MHRPLLQTASMRSALRAVLRTFKNIPYVFEGEPLQIPSIIEDALLSCMAYVDLNPVRAAMAVTPETSDHTSIKERIAPRFNLADAVKEQVALQALIKFNAPIKPLAQFEGSVTNDKQSGILFSLEDYLDLVDFTGRCVRPNKRGAIPTHLPPILQRLNLDRDAWLANATQFEKDYNTKFSRRCRKHSKTA